MGAVEKMIEKIVNGVMDAVCVFSNNVPYGDKILHGIGGALLYYSGKKLANYVNAKNKSNINPIVAGFLTAMAAETVWELIIDPALPSIYTSISVRGTIEDYIACGVGATAIVLGGLATKKLRKEKEKRKND